MEKKISTLGIVLGKFYPLHKGHIFLIEESRKKVDRLIVLIGSLQSESISGEKRFQALKTQFPDLEIQHIQDENPQFPEEHSDFWNIWKQSIQKIVPEKIDFVFSSETYGEPLAHVLNAVSICIDLERKNIPISGTKIRDNPFQYWDFLAESSKPFFVKKVVLYGPESTGKTTLSRMLAEEFNTIWIPEYARELLEEKNSDVEESDIPLIAKGQIRLEEEAIQKANKILFCDTDLLVTKVYAEHYYGRCIPWVSEAANTRIYELHLLTNNDIPHVADKLRDRGDRRDEMYTLFEKELIQSGRKFERISGNFSERFNLAKQIIRSKLLDV
jgi:HTH-type transcriptional regulator, transcriptional repressor of NAD biosynthesis genes